MKDDFPPVVEHCPSVNGTPEDIDIDKMICTLDIDFFNHGE